MLPVPESFSVVDNERKEKASLWRWENETDARDSQDERPCRKGGGGEEEGETDRRDS